MAQIVTITNPLTGQPAQVDQLEHTAQQIDDAVAASTVESTDYPGCYYRTDSGVTEWVNPPMLVGVEYRTTERYQGKPVYTKSFNIGALPAGSGTANRVRVYSATKNVNAIVDYRLVATDGGSFYTLPGRFLDDTFDCWVYGVNLSNGSPNFYICASKDMSTFTGVLTVKYTKSTD